MGHIPNDLLKLIVQRLGTLLDVARVFPTAKRWAALGEHPRFWFDVLRRHTNERDEDVRARITLTMQQRGTHWGEMWSCIRNDASSMHALLQKIHTLGVRSEITFGSGAEWFSEKILQEACKAVVVTIRHGMRRQFFLPNAEEVYLDGSNIPGSSFATQLGCRVIVTIHRPVEVVEWSSNFIDQVAVLKVLYPVSISWFEPWEGRTSANITSIDASIGSPIDEQFASFARLRSQQGFMPRLTSLGWFRHVFQSWVMFEMQMERLTTQAFPGLQELKVFLVMSHRAVQSTWSASFPRKLQKLEVRVWHLGDQDRDEFSQAMNEVGQSLAKVFQVNYNDK